MLYRRERDGMKMTPEEYGERVKKASPPSPLPADCAWAFLVGGAICLLGEVLRQAYMAAGLDTQSAGTLASVV